MMRLIFLSLLACIMPFILPAQNAPDLKPRISKNIYFDISPPLRDMLKTPPPKADRSLFRRLLERGDQLVHALADLVPTVQTAALEAIGEGNARRDQRIAQGLGRCRHPCLVPVVAARLARRGAAARRP